MRYKDSVIEAILIERRLGKTYQEIADKLKISVYKVKKAVLYGESPGKKSKKGDLDCE